MEKQYRHQDVASGTTGQPIMIESGSGAGVAVHPGTNGTMYVEFTLSHPANVKAGTAKWITWAYGTVSVATADSIIGGVSAVRATAATAAGVFQVVQGA